MKKETKKEKMVKGILRGGAVNTDFKKSQRKVITYSNHTGSPCPCK